MNSPAVAQIDGYKSDQKKWEKEILAAQKRLRTFTRQGNRAIDHYLDNRTYAADDRLDGGSNLNLFHANINTLQSMLYGSTPKITVSREHHDPDDDVARVAAVIYQRILQTEVEATDNTLACTLRSCLQDRLLPGMGVGRVRYTFGTLTESKEGEEGVESEEGADEELAYEEAPIDYVHWTDFLWSWGRTWEEVTWVAFRSWLSKDEVKARFGDDVLVEYKTQFPGDEEARERDLQDPEQKAEIWEIWSKESKCVYWFSIGAEDILDDIEDPLKLDGFLPCPRPMMANLTNNLFIAKCDFAMTQDLYNEIDLLQTRISMITRAVKVVGVYDQSASDSIGRVLSEAMENQLIPVDNWAMFAEKGGLKGVIEWLPLEAVTNTLSQLISLRDQNIDLLYQITGMSDILRGANTDQYTSDGTNQLKAKMGSIRIQALQDDFARFASDLESIKTEVISKHFSVDSIVKQASVQFLPEADRDKIGQALQLIKSPDVKWRVSIKPESIAMIDYAQLKAERTEFLTAMATYLQSAMTAVKSVPGSLPTLLELLKWGMVGFKGSDVLEGTMDRAIQQAKDTPPAEEGGGEDQMKIQLEQMRQQFDKQEQERQNQFEAFKMQQKAQSDERLNLIKQQGEQAKIAADSQANIREIEAKSMADTKKIVEDLQADLRSIAAKLDSALRVEEAQSEFAIAERQIDHAFTMKEQEGREESGEREL
jgi:hypothetical protein